MKYLFMFIIKCYWHFYPKKYKPKCLYKESCSKHIFKKFKHEGLKAGLEAFHSRIQSCRPNYRFIEIDNEIVILTSNGKVITNNEMAEWLK